MLNIPRYLIKVIQQYLKNRTFTVLANGEPSTKQKIVAGVPQGSILGPTLFLYYINDIPTPDKSQIALSADDTAVYSSSWSKRAAQENVQNHINQIIAHFHQWKIKINETKTELLFFGRKKEKQYLPPFTINNEILDDKLSFTAHIKAIKEKVQKIKGMLHNLMCRKTALTSKNKIFLYQTIIKPVMLYATPIWSNTCKSNIKKIRTIQNKILRAATNSAYHIRNFDIQKLTNIKDIHEEIYDRTYDFYKEQTKNLPVLNNIGKIATQNTHFKLKYKLLHHLVMK